MDEKVLDAAKRSSKKGWLNPFDVAELYQKYANNKLKFYYELLKSQNVRTNPILRDHIRDIIDRIINFAKDKINRIPFFNRKLPPITREQSDYTLQPEYKAKEEVTFKAFDVDKRYFNRDILDVYHLIKRNLEKGKDKHNGNVIANLSLTPRGNFLINGTEAVVLNINKYEQFAEFLKEKYPSKDASDFFIFSDTLTGAETDMLYFLNYDTPEVCEFLESVHSAERKHEAEHEQTKAGSKAQEPEAVPEQKKTEPEPEKEQSTILSDIGLIKDDIIPLKGVKTQEEIDSFLSAIRDIKEKHPEELDKLAFDFTVASGSTYLKEDENFIYLKVPRVPETDPSKSPESMIIAIPNDVFQINNDYFMADPKAPVQKAVRTITLPLSMQAMVIDESTMEPVYNDDDDSVEMVDIADLFINKSLEANNVLWCDSLAFQEDSGIMQVGIIPDQDPDNKFIYAADKNRAFVYKASSKNAEKLTIPDTIEVNGHPLHVVGVYNKAFEGLENLKEVTLGENVAIVQSKAFKDCTELTKINGGGINMDISNDAFEGCSLLESEGIDLHVHNIDDLLGKSIDKSIDKNTDKGIDEKIDISSDDEFMEEDFDAIDKAVAEEAGEEIKQDVNNGEYRDPGKDEEVNTGIDQVVNEMVHKNHEENGQNVEETLNERSEVAEFKKEVKKLPLEPVKKEPEQVRAEHDKEPEQKKPKIIPKSRWMQFDMGR